eukprot:6177465-Pleurochrysis_carterae.AAC.2
MVHFQVYEGKEAMALKEYNIGASITVGLGYPKSIALTLRMLKPYFGSMRAYELFHTWQLHATCCDAAPAACRVQSRVLVADSWFGSVACALAFFKHGIYAVLNVKTVTMDFPKDALMTKVGEIKGNTAQGDAARCCGAQPEGAALARVHDR